MVLYDGRCGLCQASVAFARSRDRRGYWQYIPNASQQGTQLLRRYGRMASSHHTLVVLDGGIPRVRSAAVVRMLHKLGGIYLLLAGILWLIPRPLRDRGYRFVAARRHRGEKPHNLSG